MDRRTRDTLRGAAAALGVATGLLALASTAQTPDGYIHASFGGPLDVFSENTADVLSIGDGANDAGELAALLKGPVGPAAKDGAADSPYRVAYEAGTAPNSTTGAATIMPSPDPVVPAPGGKDPAILRSKPVVDAQGRIDCTGAVSCKTDPSTNITTVTYPDGVVAVIQKINDLTVVAYKTVTEALPSEIATLLPPAPETPPLLAAVAPSPENTPSVEPPGPSLVPAPAPTSVPPAPAPTSVPATTAPATIPTREIESDGQPSPGGITVPKDTGQSGTESTAPSPTGAPSPGLPGKVKDALGGIADTVKGAVGSIGKALNPGASTKSETAVKSGNAGQSGQEKPGQGKSGQEKPDEESKRRSDSDEG